MLNIKRSQSSVEFIIFTGLAIIILIVFAIVNLAYLNNTLKQRDLGNAQDLAELIKNEINLASRVESGYIRIYTLPLIIENRQYNLVIQDREVFISFVGVTGQDFTEKLATDVLDPGLGLNPVNSGNNVITIRKCKDPTENVRVDVGSIDVICS